LQPSFAQPHTDLGNSLLEEGQWRGATVGLTQGSGSQQGRRLDLVRVTGRMIPPADRAHFSKLRHGPPSDYHAID
jgi:hypothetical protein